MRAIAFRSFLLAVLMSAASVSLAQDAKPINVVTTAVPFLRISPDARAGGMGDVAIATSPDASSSFYNLGKVPFNTSPGGINITYTPWLKNIANDVYLAALSGYYKLDDMQAISGSLRYFNLGQIQFTDGTGQTTSTGNPKEFGIDFGYSRKLSEQTGVGVGLKYIHSNLTAGFAGSGYKPGNAVAGDLGFYHNRHDERGQGLALGVAITNLGSKIAYTDNAEQKDFIPTNFGLGTSYTRVIDESNQISFGLDINKLLVPTPPTFTGDESKDSALVVEYRSKSVVSSWFSSFGDAPGGFSEEIREFQVGVGAEYAYSNQFFFRAGYFYEDKTKGNRRFLTAGVGVKYNVFGLNLSYLISTGSGNENQNPLSNTLRFSLAFDLGNAGTTTQ